MLNYRGPAVKKLIEELDKLKKGEMVHGSMVFGFYNII